MRAAMMAASLILLSSFEPVSAKPLFGFSINADAGIAPLVFLNDDSIGFHALFPLWGDIALESVTSAGFTLVGYGVYTTSTYPPTPGIHFEPWFHGSEEVAIGFPIRLGRTETDAIALRLHPLSFHAAWCPFYFVLFGAGISIALELRNADTGAIVRPVGLYARADYRPSVLGFNALFQAGLRFSMLW
jgi:hypothetical protein